MWKPRAAALPSTWHDRLPRANIHKQVHVIPDGCLKYLYTYPNGVK
jgi:hypothetical protein